MFWESVSAGLNTLLYWQTYAALAIFLSLSAAPAILIGYAGTRAESGGVLVGCLYMLVMPFIHAFAILVFVLTLAPILLGLAETAAWSFPWELTAKEPLLMAKFIGILLIADLVLSLFPIIGRIQSLHVMLLGSIALVLVVRLAGADTSSANTDQIRFWPGIWFVIGLAVLGSVMSWLGILFAGFLSTVIDTRETGFGQVLVFPLAALFGLLPIFVYAAWLGQQIR